MLRASKEREVRRFKAEPGSRLPPFANINPYSPSCPSPGLKVTPIELHQLASDMALWGKHFETTHATARLNRGERVMCAVSLRR